MDIPEVNLKDLKSSVIGYDYIRFTWSDMNGVARGKTITGCYIDRFLVDGIGCYSGAIAMSPQNELPIIPIFANRGSPNLYAKPVVSKVSELPWRSDKKVGEIICETFWSDGKIQEGGPRSIARKQIDKLSSLGLKMYSAFEMEFMVTDKETQKPLFDGNEFVNVFTFSKFEKMFSDFNDKMKKMGIDIETMQSEFSPGQFEFTFDPKYGIQCPDMIFQFKEAMKELCFLNGYHTTFMTRPFITTGCSNGAHLNFSLWNKENKNVFYDASMPDNLSETALHFIGGIFKHIPALTALCSPTANCYRRLHNAFAPHLADWTIDSRHVTIRAKNLSESGTYIESRLPSGSCNPYLAQAATIAAGIDGITNKLEPPEKFDKSAKEVPHSLAEALEGLKSDDYMKEALGQDFVDWFITCKEQIDITKFGKHDVKSSISEEIEAERKEYFKFM